jgi:hypothetical protein
MRLYKGIAMKYRPVRGPGSTKTTARNTGLLGDQALQRQLRNGILIDLPGNPSCMILNFLIISMKDFNGEDVMDKLNHEFLVDTDGKRKAVIIPINEWKRLMEELEELDDIKAYDKAKASPSSPVPFEDAVRQISKGTSN